jgi:hypothetical protein
VRIRTLVALLIVGLTSLPASYAASRIERIKNDKVVVTEETLAPGEQDPLPEPMSSMVVYMSDGEVEATAAGSVRREEVLEGETVFQEAHAGTMKNVGHAPLHFTRVEFLGAGSPEIWGATGLSPHYKVVVENRYARAYDIRIPAGTFEPQHTHHDRVVVTLSGAELEHILPDGTKQPSTLKTGDVVWRLGATHTGHNMGNTDLWVIAVEPK